MGNVFVVGIGPGDARFLTVEARAALDTADALCGYPAYVECIAPLYPGKEIYTTPMKQETARCRWALAAAETGKTVALVCGGDAGVYGMAGLLLELSPEYGPIEIRIVPGITAALAGAALLGAPLGHDFCVISLSDLLTPWEVLERRLRCAAEADFVICLYNPSSTRRREQFARACELLLECRDRNTVCGWTRNIGRAGEESRLLSLGELEHQEADMFTTIFIGASATKQVNGRMVTPRGYRI